MNRSWLLLVLVSATSAHAQCRLCASVSQTAPRAAAVPLRIDVEAALDLGRAAQTRPSGSGTVALDPRSGARTVTGSLADLGGFSLKGTMRLSGTPFAPVAITLPNRVALTAPDGSTAYIVEIRSDTAANTTLDAQGRLTVAFGGRLVITGGQSGDFRGRIPIVAEYR